jgi:hypothetical protein
MGETIIATHGGIFRPSTTKLEQWAMVQNTAVFTLFADQQVSGTPRDRDGVLLMKVTLATGLDSRVKTLPKPGCTARED